MAGARCTPPPHNSHSLVCGPPACFTLYRAQTMPPVFLKNKRHISLSLLFTPRKRISQTSEGRNPVRIARIVVAATAVVVDIAEITAAAGVWTALPPIAGRTACM